MVSFRSRNGATTKPIVDWREAAPMKEPKGIKTSNTLLISGRRATASCFFIDDKQVYRMPPFAGPRRHRPACASTTTRGAGQQVSPSRNCRRPMSAGRALRRPAVLRASAASSRPRCSTIALGIGLSATVFAVVDGVLFRALPYRDFQDGSSPCYA
jgi:hypothetical protein